jgi:hypothetical protein
MTLPANTVPSPPSNSSSVPLSFKFTPLLSSQSYPPTPCIAQKPPPTIHSICTDLSCTRRVHPSQPADLRTFLDLPFSMSFTKTLRLTLNAAHILLPLLRKDISFQEGGNSQNCADLGSQQNTPSRSHKYNHESPTCIKSSTRVTKSFHKWFMSSVNLH